MSGTRGAAMSAETSCPKQASAMQAHQTSSESDNQLQSRSTSVQRFIGQPASITKRQCATIHWTTSFSHGAPECNDS
eukprot:1161421-Pelagomonas_calceolata.AAC.4